MHFYAISAGRIQPFRTGEGNGMVAYAVGIALLLFSWFLLVRSIVTGSKALVVLSVALIAMNNYSIGRWKERIKGPGRLQ